MGEAKGERQKTKGAGIGFDLMLTGRDSISPLPFSGQDGNYPQLDAPRYAYGSANYLISGL